MPQIQQYTSPVNGLQPTETGIEANVQAANRIGRFSNQVAAATSEVGNDLARGVAGDVKAVGDVAVQYVDYTDRSKTSAAATAGVAGLEQKWQQTLKGVPDPNNPGKYLVPPADPNDPTVKEKFQTEQVDPFLENLQGIPLGENGQRYAEAKAEEIRQHISNKMTADMSSQAGNAIVLNRMKTVNNLGALVSTDPSFSTVDFALKQSRDDMDSHTASPTLTADQIGRLKIHQTEDEMRIVHAAAVSAIGKSSDPESTAQAFITKYPDLIKGDEANTLAKAAVVTNKTNLLATKQTQLYQKQLDTMKVEKGANDVFTRNVSTDASGKVIVNQQFFKDALNLVKNNPDAPNASTVGKTLLDWGESQQKERPAATDQATVTALDSRMFADGNPTSEIDVLRAEADGKLSRQDGQVRLQLIKQRDQMPYNPALKSDRNEFFKRYAGTIDGYLAQYGIHSALGQQRMFMAEKDAVTQEIALQKAGQDPHSLYDPSSPNFFGRPENMARYHITMQQGVDFAADKGSQNLTGPGKNITGVDVQNAPVEKPPVPGARKAADQNWYIEKDGKYFRVKQ